MQTDGSAKEVELVVPHARQERVPLGLVIHLNWSVRTGLGVTHVDERAVEHRLNAAGVCTGAVRRLEPNASLWLGHSNLHRHAFVTATNANVYFTRSSQKRQLLF